MYAESMLLERRPGMLFIYKPLAKYKVEISLFVFICILNRH